NSDTGGEGMQHLGFLIAVLVLAGVAGSVAAAQQDAGRPICKRTTSKTKTYVMRSVPTAKVRAADISPVPAGGCPRTVLTATSGCAPAARKLVSAILKSPASYYVNVHAPESQGGAIRGQLAGTSASSFGWVVAIDLKGSSEPNAKGTAVVRIRKDAGLVCYRL